MAELAKLLGTFADAASVAFCSEKEKPLHRGSGFQVEASGVGLGAGRLFYLCDRQIIAQR